MFQIEILKLLNEYKKSTDEYTLNRIKEAIYNLILQNSSEFESFLQTDQLDQDTKNFLMQCKNEAEEKNKQVSESEENEIFSMIKQYYMKWLQYFKNNNNVPEENCEQIIDQIISYCIEDKYLILNKILEIEDSSDYEAFKNMMKNYIRKHLSQKVLNYYNGEKFKSLSFFEKRKKRKELVTILDEIGSYRFNYDKIYKEIDKK